MRYPAFAFTLVAIAGVTLASACGQPFPPTGTLFRITNDGPRIRERPSAISDRFAVFEGNADSIKVYDRYSRVTSEIAREFQIGVDASNTHVAWQTPYGGTVYFLKVWEKATGRVSLIDTERGHTFGRRDFIGDRLVYSNLLNDYIRIWDPDTDTVEELVPECNFDYWDATPAFVAWTCPFEGLVVLYDLANDSVTEITSPPEYNRPRRIELADEWVVWGVERGYVLAAPLEGGPIRTIAAGLHYYDRDDFNAAGRFAAWWRSGQIQLHDLHADTTTTVGSDVLRGAPILTPRYLIWLEGTARPRILRVRNLATGLEMVDGPVEAWDFSNLWAAEDSLTYFSDTERDVFVFEIDGDGDGLRDRDERRFHLGGLDDPDTDGDGTLDGSEDPDSDGIRSSDEIDFYWTDPTLPDSDGDGLSDSIELFVLGTNPLSEDSDGDGLDDGAEDEDGDGLSNASEVGPDPGQALDTDGDGVPDVIDDDDDGDGVPTNEDACFPTPVGEVVRADGCSVSQLCPCEHPIVEDEWKNHGAYVSCVAHTANAFSAMGLIAEGERGAIVSTAAQSTCGHKNK